MRKEAIRERSNAAKKTFKKKFKEEQKKQKIGTKKYTKIKKKENSYLLDFVPSSLLSVSTLAWSWSRSVSS